MSEPQRIVAAAIHVPGNRTYTLPPPARHWHLIKECLKARVPEPIHTEWMGFIDQHGLFVPRKDAMAVAEAAGQLDERPCPTCFDRDRTDDPRVDFDCPSCGGTHRVIGTLNPATLLSEDLW